jgi:hypothetical protein
MAVDSSPFEPLIPADASVNPRKVSLPPSGPVKSGFCLTTGVANLAPVVSNNTGAPPCDEYDSGTAGFVPQFGVWK